MKNPAKISLLLAVVAAIAVAIFWFNRTAELARHPAGNPAISTTTPAAQPARVIQSSVQNLQQPQVEALSEQMRLIVRPDGKTGFKERVAAVHAIKEDLNNEELRAFYGYLLAPAHDQGDREQENWLRNEMLDKLVTQQKPPAGLIDVLNAIYQDKDQDVVMRDYAIQHMNPAYAQANTEEKTALRQALWQATGETDGSIAGTALLALNDLAQNNAEFEKNKITEVALKLAGDEQCGELARITAVQICGRSDATQAVPLVLQLAQSAGSIPLRISAIAALGDLGDRSVETVLQQIATGNEDRLKPAAESALQRLNKRLGT
jgi:hypothetical protein